MIVYDSQVEVSSKNAHAAMMWLIRRGNLQHFNNEGVALDFADWLGDSYSANPVPMPNVDFCFHENEREIAMLFKLTWGGQ